MKEGSQQAEHPLVSLCFLTVGNGASCLMFLLLSSPPQTVLLVNWEPSETLSPLGSFCQILCCNNEKREESPFLVLCFSKSVIPLALTLLEPGGMGRNDKDMKGSVETQKKERKMRMTEQEGWWWWESR